jgi:phage gp29-like protein
MPQLIDPRGRPLRGASQASHLSRPYALPTLTGVRQVWDAASVASGLTPETLAGILRQADLGDGRSYLRLAMEMEQREAHYRSVLGTRKRAVTRLPVTVEAASDAAADQALADEVRALLRAPGFRGMLGHALDGLGKGYAAIEVRWDTRRSPWLPRDRTDPVTGERIRGYQWIDPRWFRYDRATGRSLRLLDDSAPIEGLPLPPYRYLVHEPELMSGLPLGAGLARVACIAYMAKSYTLKDWLAFAEVYGMPLRVGKWGAGASEEDIATLVSAVANLGTDAAAAIPESMSIDFVEAAKSSSSEVFATLAGWADSQLSKLVLGQTASADGTPGALGGNQAQDEVRDDIRDADAEELADTLNRDLVGAYLALNHGALDPEDAPRVLIQAQEPEDIQALSDALAALVPLGLRVEASVIRDKLGLADPAHGAEVLGAPTTGSAGGPPGSAGILPATGSPGVPPGVNLNRQADPKAAPAPSQALLGRLRAEAQPQVRAMIEQVRSMLAAADTMEEALAMLETAYPDLDAGPLAETLTQAALVARLAGRADVLDEIADAG